ncbi:MAG: cytochrome b N-terminal domain-containing protein [candidate division Zixibacteria bacterium]|nr:cytochrome b N-terminal domain-containing protein [Candidatus Tariuqbacter arcticus]
MGWINTIWKSIDQRLEITPVIEKEMIHKQVPKLHRWWDHAGLSCFGGLSLVLFMVQLVSGFILLVYYIPHSDHAYNSIVFMENQVAFGWFWRRIHAVGSNLMVFTVIVHMLKVFYTGAYHNPREMHWLTGFFLFLMTLGSAFSGYILPWSQMSFWAATVVTDAMAVIPFLGEWTVQFIRGGELITGVTLGRFFALHMVLPVVMIVFMGMHFMMIRKTGISEPL